MAIFNVSLPEGIPNVWARARGSNPWYYLSFHRVMDSDMFSGSYSYGLDIPPARHLPGSLQKNGLVKAWISGTHVNFNVEATKDLLLKIALELKHVIVYLVFHCRFPADKSTNSK